MATAAAANLSLNLQDAAKIAPGSLISLFGSGLADRTESAPSNIDQLPTNLGNTQLFVDGQPAPLYYASPSQISGQLGFEANGRSSVSAYLRTLHADGSITVSNPQAISVVPANPGIFAADGLDPRPARVYHAYSNATGIVSVDGSITAGDVGTITIAGTTYTYTVLATDTLDNIRDAFIGMINQDTNSPVTAIAGNVFDRIVLQAKIAGPDSNGTAYSVNVTKGTGLLLTPYTTTLCCSNAAGAGAEVTPDNPAIPGEIVYVLATGLGPTVAGINSGKIATNFSGSGDGGGDSSTDPPVTPVDSILAGGSSGNIINTGYALGMAGVFRVEFQLSSALTSNSQTQLTIAQNFFVSNVVTFPVAKP